MSHWIIPGFTETCLVGGLDDRGDGDGGGGDDDDDNDDDEHEDSLYNMYIYIIIYNSAWLSKGTSHLTGHAGPNAISKKQRWPL